MGQPSSAAGSNDSGPSGIGVVDKSVAILAAVAAAPRALADLVATTALPRATAHRLAVALETHRLLGRDVEGRVRRHGKVRDLGPSRFRPCGGAAPARGPHGQHRSGLVTDHD